MFAPKRKSTTTCQNIGSMSTDPTTVKHPTGLEYTNGYFLSYIISADNKPFKSQLAPTSEINNFTLCQHTMGMIQVPDKMTIQ